MTPTETSTPGNRTQSPYSGIWVSGCICVGLRDREGAKRGGRRVPWGEPPCPLCRAEAGQRLQSCYKARGPQSRPEDRRTDRRQQPQCAEPEALPSPSSLSSSTRSSRPKRMRERSRQLQARGRAGGREAGQDPIPRGGGPLGGQERVEGLGARRTVAPLQGTPAAGNGMPSRTPNSRSGNAACSWGLALGLTPTIESGSPLG